MTKPTPLAAPPPEAYVLPYGIAGGYPMSYATLLVEPKDGYLIIRLNRPEALNALNGQLMDELSGAGGGQRLTRFTSKAKAMELILTGRMMDAADALQAGLVSRVVPLAKELVNAAYETPLSQGIKQERRAFQSLFAFDDQKEGMAAFTEKRKPKFQGK